ncbi:hypothetical protein ACFU7T_16775 [Streptomyces sp. NPDC057555]|uniref:hypothetical protein n=1 Tax=Streptomyces sp. NPDC057555 TaxID=3346166 RepID=UPI0036AB17B2
MTADPFRILRIDDMLLLHVEVVNLRIDGARLVREDPTAPAQVLLHLPSQHVSEGVLTDGQSPPTVPAFAAGQSTLAFLLPDGQDGIDLSVGALLDWNSLDATIAPVGQTPDDPNDPSLFGGMRRTAIEFPTRLLLGHDDLVIAWSQPLAQPAVLDGRAELWHAELHGENAGPAHVKAYAVAPGRPPRLGTALDGSVLKDLVTLTSDGDLVGSDGMPVRRSLEADRFLFTPLGATVRLSGSWDLPPTFAAASLTGYEHVASLGREQYVHTDRQGFLSSGHRATFVQVTKRLYDDPGDGTSVAYLHQEQHIRVDQPEVAYGVGAGYDEHEGRQQPFQSLRLTDQVTPSIDGPEGAGAFWVTVNGAPLLFHATATDAEGRHIGITMPLVFAFSESRDQMASVYNSPATADRTDLGLGGQTVALASGGDPSTASMPVTSARFALVPASGHPAGVLPALVDAVARVPAVEQLTGLTNDIAVKLHDAYLAQGLDSQPTGAFLSLVDALPLRLPAEAVGGLASPSTVVQTVTTRAGVLAPQFLTDAGDAAGVDSTTLGQIFGGAKLLGPIDLSTLLADVPAGSVTELKDLGEEEIRRRLDGVSPALLPVPIMRVSDLVDGSELRYVWKPQLTNTAPLLDLSSASLVLEATTVRSPEALSKSNVHGELRSFAFAFAGVVSVHFDRLTFTARPGSTPDVTAAGVALAFHNDLEFVNQLREALPADVFGTGAFVDVDTSGVTAGYSLTLPTLSLGMFNLSNLSLSARLTIPFDDKPARFRFAVSERHNPFNVSVSLFGGGGFFALEVGTHGIELVEGALEFGGNAALDLGVASGGVHLMAGIAFQLSGDAVTLTGYLRCGGYLSVLGVVGVSVEFYLALTYHKDPDKKICEVVAQGSITVSVHVAIFSKSVNLPLERRFTGSGSTSGDPSFTDCVLPRDWDAYCLSFAE